MPRFSSKALWLEPFYEVAIPYLPKRKLKRLTDIRLVLPPAGYTAVQGMYTHHIWEDRYTIWLISHCRRILGHGKPFKMIKLNAYEILENFAHELAHFKHYDHTPEHQMLTCELGIQFMKKLKRLGFKSTEADCRSTYHEKLNAARL